MFSHVLQTNLKTHSHRKQPLEITYMLGKLSKFHSFYCLHLFTNNLLYFLFKTVLQIAILFSVSFLFTIVNFAHGFWVKCFSHIWNFKSVSTSPLLLLSVSLSPSLLPPHTHTYHTLTLTFLLNIFYYLCDSLNSKFSVILIYSRLICLFWIFKTL